MHLAGQGATVASSEAGERTVVGDAGARVRAGWRAGGGLEGRSMERPDSSRSRSRRHTLPGSPFHQPCLSFSAEFCMEPCTQEASAAFFIPPL